MFRFRYEYQPCSNKNLFYSMTRVTIRFLLPAKSQVWLPWHHQGFPVQHLWRHWGNGSRLDFFPNFVTMTFQEKTTLVSSCQAGSNVAVPGADLIYMGWILHVNFRKESLEFLNLRLFVSSRNDGWNECLMEPALEEMRTWTERFSLISVPFATIQTRTAERPKTKKKHKIKKMLARVWGLVYVLAFT